MTAGQDVAVFGGLTYVVMTLWMASSLVGYIVRRKRRANGRIRRI